MRRALAILKYLPAVLCGLLMVAWGVSVFWETDIRLIEHKPPTKLYRRATEWCVWSSAGTLHFGQNYLVDYDIPFESSVYFGALSRPPSGQRLSDWFGKVSFVRSDTYVTIGFPFSLILSAILPVAIFPFTRFRFRLWSYFAWTALIAVELAYYLRAT